MYLPGFFETEHFPDWLYWRMALSCAINVFHIPLMKIFHKDLKLTI